MGVIVGSIAAAIGEIALAAGATAATAATVGTIGAGALVGAGIGAGGAALTGGKPLVGAITGGLTGGLGAAGAGSALGSALGNALGVEGGLSASAGNAIIGAGVGALGSSLSGGSPIMGALSGGAGGYLTSALGASGTTGPLAGALGDTGDSWSSSVPTQNAGLVPTPLGSQSAVDAGSWNTPPAGGGTYDPAAAQNILNPQSAASQGSFGSGSGNGKTGGILSSPALALGALAMLGALKGKPQQGTYPTPGPSSVSANLGPYFNQPLNTNFPGRTAVTPDVQNWYTYGQIPGGANFYTGNSLKNFGFAHGGALGQAAANQNGEFTTEGGQGYVRGPGDGKSDSVPALLSDGEYVLRADEVAALGHGSNEAGARRLDAARQKLARTQGRAGRTADAKGGGALSSLLKVA